jgi:NADH dehydrogenase/NADH:ubiquinone oxidoreductase subunit G
MSEDDDHKLMKARLRAMSKQYLNKKVRTQEEYQNWKSLEDEEEWWRRLKALKANKKFNEVYGQHVDNHEKKFKLHIDETKNRTKDITPFADRKAIKRAEMKAEAEQLANLRAQEESVRVPNDSLSYLAKTSRCVIS